MKLSLNWIRDFVKVPKIHTGPQLSDLLTLHTAEVEEVMDMKDAFDGVVVGEIKKIEKHPDADKLSIAQVDIGKKTIQLIFGQMVAMEVGLKVPVAVAPTTLPTGMEILPKKLRGVQTNGMLCLDQELGLASEGVSIQFFDKDVKPGTPFAEAMKFDDMVFDIDNKSLTHRPDLWGHYGFAREFSALLDIPLKGYEEATGSDKVSFPEKGEEVKVTIEDEKISPRFCATIVTGVKIEDSPDWLKARLEACGVRPVNNVVDITNYVMLELGEPMHAFDRKTVGTDHLEARFAKKGEKLETLDHKKRTLTKEDIVISNGKKALGLAGVMGGVDDEITEDTKEIIFEAANWNPVIVRRTSQRHNLRSDAVQRFEKSLDPEMCEQAVRRACSLLMEICPSAKLAGPLTDVQNYTLTLPKIAVDFPRVLKKIGTDIDEENAKKHLAALGFTVELPFNVTVPSWRATKDVDIEDDIVEEIARMHGYENIPNQLPDLPTKTPTENRERALKHKARNILSIGLGFTEMMSYSFYGEEEMTKCGMTEDGHIKLENYLSSDQTHLRTTLTPNLLKRVQQNLPNFDNFKIYEIGRSYKEVGEYFPLEEKGITAMIVQKSGATEAFAEARGACEEFLNRFGTESWKIKELKDVPPYAHPSKSAGVYVNGEFIGLIFEIHPVIARNHEFDKHGARVGAFWIHFNKLVDAGQQTRTYRPLSKFPGIRFDVSVVVDEREPVGNLEKHIYEGGKLVNKVELFDTFKGEGIEKGQKACAFTVTLQAEDRTLTDDEMTNIQQKIFENLQKAGGTIRGL